MPRHSVYQYMVKQIQQKRMLSISVCSGPRSRSSMKADSDGHESAVQFMGFLRKDEDTLTEVTRSLAKKDKAFIQEMFTTRVDEWTPLHACTLRGARKLVKIALKAGVNPNLEMGVPDGLPGRCSPLHLAAYRGDVSIIQLLIQYGANLEKRDSKNYTPLHYAVLKRNTLAARKLLKFGADASVLTLEERMFYKDDIDSKSSGVLCVPVKATSKTNSKFSDVPSSNSKHSGTSASSSKYPEVGSSNSKYSSVSATNSKYPGVSSSKYAGVGAASSKDRSRSKVS
ncbi:serine/threonine-protein phosphatase 6 regulatory ankyrin repeat subunit C-like isoform X1 [Biomphalaria pfeifferi]|uniref:Serine/threonine-protein phosphatase 6 regulatory ankyrin repeat subunit C-like isoform X1 n=1 Tax=Biomphalaria pfeifferi TaxID=112525 RepID=A0AAD8ATF5_BIOPF|nr:serine/threonine-protein phosphatase 6 regulatory ankyrin repeat subunit C-like isoform X1 [Biomphalaria pfeifferi]